MTRRRYDVDRFEQEVYAQIERGNNTVNLVAQSLKISYATAKGRLNDLFTQGKINCNVVDGVKYYSRGYYRAHDPFFLCPEPVGDLDGLIRQSHASP